MIHGERTPVPEIAGEQPGPSPAAPISAPQQLRGSGRWPLGWAFGKRSALIVLAVLLALDVWALSSADPDFYLPDFFRPLGIGLIGLFFVSGWIRFGLLRRAIRTLGFVTVLALLVAEVNSRYRDGGADRVEATDDILLRYRYRPGHEERTADGSTIRVNHLGLLDAERAIPKPSNVFRIVVLTGSIANDHAIAYEDRFYRQLERDLAGALPGKRIETVNVSCEGYNTLQQVRILENVGLLYEPDIVVVGYMLSAASLQNGGYRRIGNSFFLFRYLPAIKEMTTGSLCSIFEPLHERYSFDLIVRNSFERLALLRDLHGFRVLVAVLPVVEHFDDPICARIYDRVMDVAKETGLDTLRVPDAFIGQSPQAFAKPGVVNDVCHPNPAGHRLIGSTIAASLRSMLERADIEPTP